MDKEWCTGNDLIKLWGVTDRDITGFIKKGLLKPYLRLGNKMAMSIQYGLPNSNKPLSQIESEVRNNIRIFKNEKSSIIIGSEINYGVVWRLSNEIIIDEEIRQVPRMSSSYRIPTEQEVKSLSKLLCEKQPDSTYIPVPSHAVRGHHYFGFMSEEDTFPAVASRLFFQKEDVHRFAEEYCFPMSSSSEEEQTISVNLQKKTSPDDLDTFIRSIQFCFVSDTEIKIRGGGKNAKIYDMKAVGFQKEKSKVWKAFITILTSKDHLYHVGKAHGAEGVRKTAYDQGRKVPDAINKKLIPFLNNIYQMQLPADFKVYELIPEKKEAPGIYRFKFQIKSNIDAESERFNALPQSELLQQIEELSGKFKKLSEVGTEAAETQVERIKNELYTAVEIALQKEWLPRNRAAYYMNEQSEDSPHVVYPMKVEGRWTSDINDISPVEHPLDDEESSQEG